MPQAAFDRIHAQMNRVNTLERTTRDTHYKYLTDRGDKPEPYEQYMATCASYARFGEPATESEIAHLQLLSGPELPPDLTQFYRTLGTLSGGARLQDLVVYAPRSLLEFARPDAAPYQRIVCIGLVDMIVLSWGGDRLEFDPNSSGGLTSAEVALLNARYSVVGHHAAADGEAAVYLFFDQRGQFGTLFYHQDAFDEFYADHLIPLLQSSSASQTFDQALAAFVDTAAAL
jgi:hypothetical protein